MVGAWQPSAGAQQISIWPGEAPDPVTNPRPESVGPPAGRDWWPRVNDVSRPTMTIYAPHGHNAHAAIVVFPGGGFEFLAMDLEGTEICDWLTSRGITCILSKYRVPDSNHHWDESCHCSVTPRIPRALQDAQRTIRLVRQRAADLDVDPNRIGVIGFSAGGYLVAQTSNIFAPTYTPVDAADSVSSRPDFAIALYPGHLCRAGGVLDPGLHVTHQTPPTFLVQAWDDPVDDVCNSTLYARALDAAGVPAEVHLFAKGGHAFALRHPEQRIAIWSTLVEGWLRERGVL
ncbi:MAG: alpha/beta hydrolase [Proteobacteria bacterium]|nr:alpha/beta hydrolase [Pseudomonadota bacterium]